MGTKNGRKRKKEQNGDAKHSESKKNKKSKGSHLRRNIKNILDADSLQAEAKAAKAEEQERLKRLHDAQLAQKNILLNQRTPQHPPQEIDQKATKERNDEVINISSSSGEESKKNRYQAMASTVLNRMYPNQKPNITKEQTPYHS